LNSKFDLDRFLFKIKTSLGDYSRFPSPFIEGDGIGLKPTTIEKIFSLDEIFSTEQFYDASTF